MLLEGHRGILYNDLMRLEGEIEKQKKVCNYASARPDLANPYHEKKKLEELTEKYNEVAKELKETK